MTQSKEVLVKVSFDKSVSLVREMSNLSKDIRIWSESSSQELKKTLENISTRMDQILKQIPEIIVFNPYSGGQF